MTRSGTVHVRSSTRDHGDFNPDRVSAHQLEQRRRQLVDLPWTMLDEVHGSHAVVVDTPGAGDGAVGDVLVTDLAGAALGVWVGDCAPVAIVGEHGRFAMVHAGWRGLTAGVLEVACDAVGADGSADVAAYLGPCIDQCCYEFGDDDLGAVATTVGLPRAAITGTTSWGTTALDVPTVVQLVLARRGIGVDRAGGCTGCGGRHFSHRVRVDPERHVMVAWKQDP